MLATLFYDEVEVDTILRIPSSLEKKSLCEKTERFSRSPVDPVEGEGESGSRNDLNASDSTSPLFPSFYPSSVLHGSLSFPELEASVLWWVSPQHTTTIFLLGVNNCNAVGAARRRDCCLLPIELPIAHGQSLLTCGIIRQGSGGHCVTVVWATTSLEVGMVGLVIQREQGSGRHHTFTSSPVSPTSLSPTFFFPKSSTFGGEGGVGNLPDGCSSTETGNTGSPLGSPLGSVGGVSSWKSGNALLSTGGYGKLCLQVDDSRCVSGLTLSEVRDAFASEAEQESRNSYKTRQSPLTMGIPEVQMLFACILSDVPPSNSQGEGKNGSKNEICAVFLVTNGRSIWRVFLHLNGTVSQHAFVDNKRVSLKLHRDSSISRRLSEKEGLFRSLSDRDLMELSNLQEWKAVQELAQRKNESLSSSWISRLHDGESSVTDVPGEGRGTVSCPSSSTVSSRWWSGFFSGKSRCHIDGTTTSVTNLLPGRRYLCICAVQESPGWFALLRWDGLLEFYDGLSEDIAPLWFHFPTCRVPHVSDAARLGELGSFSVPTHTTAGEGSSFVSFSQWAKFTPSTQKIDVVTIATSMRRSSEKAYSPMQSGYENGRKDQEYFTRRGRLGGRDNVSSSSFCSPSGSYQKIPHREEKVDEGKDGEMMVDSQLVFWTSAPTNLPYSAEERIALRNSVVLTPPFPGGVLYGCSISCRTSSGDADVKRSTTSSIPTTPASGISRTQRPNTLVSRLTVLWAGSASSDFLSVEEEDGGKSTTSTWTGGGSARHVLYSTSDSSRAIKGKHRVPRCSIASMLQSTTSCRCDEVTGRCRKVACHRHSLLQTVDAVEHFREEGDDNTNDARRSEKEHWKRVERSDEGLGSLSSLAVGLSGESRSGTSSSEGERPERGGERRVCGDHIYRVEGGTLSAILTLEESTAVAVETYLDYHRLHVVEDGASSGVGNDRFSRSPLDDLLERTTLPLPFKKFRHRFRGRESNESTEEEEEEEEDDEEEIAQEEERRSGSGEAASYYFPSKGFRSLHLTPCDGRDVGIPWNVTKRWLQEQISGGPSSDACDLSLGPFHSIEDEAERNAMAVFSVIVDALEHHSDGARVLLQLLCSILDREPSSLQTDGALSGSNLDGFSHGSELPLDPYGVKYCLTPSRVLGALYYALRYDLRLAVSFCSFSSAPVSSSHFSRYYIAASISRHLLHRLTFVACLYLGWTSRTNQQEVADEDENFCAAPSTDRVSVQLRLALEYLSAAFFTVQSAGADVANFGALMAPSLLAASGAVSSSSVPDTEAGGPFSSSVPLPPFATVGPRPSRTAPLGILYRDAVLFSFLSPDILNSTSTRLIERCVSIGWGFYKGSSNGVSSSSRSGQTFPSRGGVQAALVWAVHMGARVPLLQHFLVLQDLEAGRTRRTNESLIPRCREMMKALSSFSSPLSSSPSVLSPTSLSFPSESASGTMISNTLLELGFLLTEPTGCTYFSLMRVEVLHFLLERHPEMGPTWYAVGLLRRLVGPKGSGILLATAASVGTFFLVELRKLRAFVEEEIQSFASTSGTVGVSGSSSSVRTPDFTGGWSISPTMWSSVWEGLLELHIDTLLALAYATLQEGDVAHAFRHLDNVYRMITNSPTIASVGEKCATTTSTTGTAATAMTTTMPVADGVESAGCGATTTRTNENETTVVSLGVAPTTMGDTTTTTTIQSHPHLGNVSLHPFLQNFLSPLYRMFTLLVRRVCSTPTDVLLLSEMPSLSPLLDEWLVEELAKWIVELRENEGRMHSLREASVYALHRFLLQRHAYGECGRMMSDLASILRGSGCVVEQPLQMNLIARLSALALNAVEMIHTGTAVPQQVAVCPFTKKKRTTTGIVAADGRHSEDRNKIFPTSPSAEGCASSTVDAVPKTSSTGFSLPFSTLSARALSRKDLPWLRLRVYVAHCESLLGWFLPCEKFEKGKEEEEEGKGLRHANFSLAPPHAHPMTGRRRREASTLPPGGSTAVSSTTAEKWMDLWKEDVPVKLVYTAAAELGCTLGAHQRWREAFRFTVLFRAVVRKKGRLVSGSAWEDPFLSASPAFSSLEESVDPCRVLECWAASLATRTDPYVVRPSSKRRKERSVDPPEWAGDILSLVEEKKVKSEEEEEEWDALLLGCAECSSLSNQFRGFRVALIAALTADYGRTPKRLLEAYRLVDSYGALKSLLAVEHFFQQEEDSSRNKNGKINFRGLQRLACVACIDAAYIAKRVLEEASTCASSSSSFCFTAGVFDTLAREIRHFKALSPEVFNSLDNEQISTQFLEQFAQFVTCQTVC